MANKINLSNTLNSIQTLSKTEQKTRLIAIDAILLDDEFKSLYTASDAVIAMISEDMSLNGFDEGHPVQLLAHHYPKADGQRISLQEGHYILIDGHTRLLAAKQAGLSHVYATTHRFKDRGEIIHYIRHIQSARRNLSRDELSKQVAWLANYYQQNRLRGDGKTAALIANELGTSQATVERMIKEKKPRQKTEATSIEIPSQGLFIIPKKSVTSYYYDGQLLITLKHHLPQNLLNPLLSHIKVYLEESMSHD